MPMDAFSSLFIVMATVCYFIIAGSDTLTGNYSRAWVYFFYGMANLALLRMS